MWNTGSPGVSAHILIIGGGLAGLTTAYRLVSFGYRVSLLDKGPGSQTFLHEPQGSVRPPLNSQMTFPFILHRFQDVVWALLRELGTAPLLQHELPIQLEFVRSPSQPVAFRPFPAPPPFHTLLGLLTFRALPVKDRWSLLNIVEKFWEGETELPKDLESQTAESWLTGLGQSARACRNVWNPLCQLFIGDSLSQSSAHYFLEMVTRGFLSARRSHETFIPPHNESSLFIKPLCEYLRKEGVEYYSMTEATHIQCNAQEITGVTVRDGTTMTANAYVAAIPPRALMACLPERLLAKYAYFCNLSNLVDTPALIVHLHAALPSPRPRLFLCHQNFHWIASRPERKGSKGTTFFSCIATGNQNLLNQPDHLIFERALTDIRHSLHALGQQGLQTPLGAQVIRLPQSFLSPHPSLLPHRPLQQTPISNFYLAGPWTDTGLPASRESSIVSGHLCAQSIAASTRQQNIDNLIHQF